MGSEDTRRAAADLNRAFAADLETLPEAEWWRQSDCAGWSVGAVVVHQTQVAEMLADSLARGRAGDAGPPARAAESIHAWRAWRAGELSRRAAQAPAEMLAQYRARAAELERELEGVPEAPAEARGWHPVGPQPFDWLLDQWLFELALHDWDIRVSADPGADLRPECLPAFARTLPARFGRSFSGADNPAIAGLYRVELAGAGSQAAWQIRVGDGRVEIGPPDAPAPDATIRTDPAAFALVMTNRRPADSFRASGRWRADGDVARADAFARAFRSY